MWKFLKSDRNDHQRIEAKLISKDESYLYNSEKMAIKPHQKYKATIELIGIKGKPYSAYFTAIILGSKNKEIIRHIRWINDFSRELKQYTIIFTAEAESKSAVLGYRINIETPLKSDIELSPPDQYSLKLEELNDDKADSFDDLNDFKVPPLPPLTEDEENVLEKKIVWIIGSPRSGTTWLGTQLLSHQDNIIWNEPTIGYHLDIVGYWRQIDGTDKISSSYFFSPHHKNNWIPALRKLILARTYSLAQTLTKNVIVKEPAGSASADIIMQCTHNSKLIFLLRDGRDVVESFIDAHRPDSWNRLFSKQPLLTEESRYEAIKRYSHLWKRYISIITKAYLNHNPSLCLLVKYEDLKKDTLTELRKIYNFIGIRISDNELREIVQRYDFKNIPESEKGPGKFNRSATPRGWKNSFTEKEQELMNSIMGDTLTQMSYEISVENIENVLDDNEHIVAKNYETWQSWDWESGGEEWTVSPEWKQSLIKEVMLKYIQPGKTVLEIGPGAGRWTESLQKIARLLILVDLSDKCIELCKQRFCHCDNVQYFVNDGSRLDFIPDETVDFIWSFDVFVHINPSDTEKYIKEFSRILVKGGRGIIHHPREGDRYGGWRSKMTAELFSNMLRKHSLTLVTQFDSWGEKEQFTVRVHHDAISVFEKAELHKSTW